MIKSDQVRSGMVGRVRSDLVWSVGSGQIWSGRILSGNQFALGTADIHKVLKGILKLMNILSVVITFTKNKKETRI